MFDEATSALDNLTQAVVTESITRELKGITRLVIAHRLTTVIHADRIYVMKKGTDRPGRAITTSCWPSPARSRSWFTGRRREAMCF